MYNCVEPCRFVVVFVV